MNKTKPITAEQAVRVSRERLITGGGMLPFFGLGSMKLIVKESKKLSGGTAATDGTRLVYDPDYILSLTPKQRLFVIAHEAFHCHLRHPYRMGNRDPHLANIAMDQVTNRELLKIAGMEPPPGYIVPEPRFDGWAWEAIYAVLYQEREQRRKQKQQKKQKQEKSEDDSDQGEESQCGGGESEESDEESNEDSQAESDENEDDSTDTESGDDSNESETDQDDSEDDSDESGESDSDNDDNSESEDDTEEGSDSDNSKSEDLEDENDQEEESGSDSDSDQDDSEAGEGDDDSGGEENESLSTGSVCKPGSLREEEDQVNEQQDLEHTEHEMTELDWQIAAEQAMAVCQRAGTMPGGAALQVKEGRKRDPNPLEILKQFVEACIPKEVDWSRPSRRFADSPDIFLPGIRKENLPRIVAAVDTSGSVLQVRGLLELFMDYLTVILQEYRPERLDVVYCDEKILGIESFTPDDPQVKAGDIVYQAKGGGGTTFRPVFDWIDESNDIPVCVLYFTDLEAYFDQDLYYRDGRLFISAQDPELNQYSTRRPDYPVIFVTPETCQLIAPWGETIQVSLHS